jgi:hypothetical protein
MPLVISNPNRPDELAVAIPRGLIDALFLLTAQLSR